MECGFIFTGEHPAEQEIGKYYESDDYISHSDTSKGLINKLYQVARNFMLGRKVFTVKKLTQLQSGTLLDIGSGTGYFADVMKRSGWNVRGIEINEKAREFSRSNFNLDVSGPGEINRIPSCTYDCITLWHVLEHFQDPEEYMREISRLLKPEGLCLIALPNCSSYDAGHYKKFWAAYDVPRHLWHFSPGTFKKFADKTGFEIIRTLTLPLDVFYISMMSEKYKGSKMAFMKGMVKGKWFFIRSLFRKEKSSSLVYVLKKRC
jgi:SAM-dependent methyltransferase